MGIEKTKDVETIARLNEPVQTLHNQLYPERFKKYNYKEVYKYFVEIVNEDNQHFYVYSLDNSAVGYIWFTEIQKKGTAFSKKDHYIYIQQVSVNENYQGLGIGKQLFNEVLHFAKEKSIKRIGLDYWVENVHAKSVYKKLGFELEKEVTYLSF
jgi:ribosomal protein S18 acetylase RimI-like enzyme